jgi:hypothetical protein
MKREIERFSPAPERSETIVLPQVLVESLVTGNAIMDDEKNSWNRMMTELMSKASKLIALRGAGSWNGMDPAEVDTLIVETLVPMIERQLQQPGLVVIMHDGDYDEPSEPDLGYVAGRLLQRFGNAHNRVVFIVAQKESWHPDELAGLNLRNAQDMPYATYLFNQGYADNHSSFTQSSELVRSQKYEQWYIGASGLIASSQLLYYTTKVPAGSKRTARLFRVKNNQALDQKIHDKIESAKQEGNQEKVDGLEKRVVQRQRLYGTHWGNDGQPDLDVTQFPNLDFEFIS